jgi:hypothetical protein
MVRTGGGGIKRNDEWGLLNAEWGVGIVRYGGFCAKLRGWLKINAKGRSSEGSEAEFRHRSNQVDTDLNIDPVSSAFI